MKLRKRKPIPLSVPTTSMGDIAFLLTIFFILTSNFIKEARLEWKAPLSRDVETVKESTVSVAIDKESDFYVNGKKVDGAGAVENSLTVLFAVTDENNGKKDEKQAKRVVMFSCDQSVDRKVFEPVLEAISKAGAEILAVGTKTKDSASSGP